MNTPNHQPTPDRLDQAMHALRETRIPALPESLMASTVEAMNSRVNPVEPVSTTPLATRRRLSMARYFRFGSALAAMALLATLAGLLFITTPQASAWQDVVEQVKKASSVTFEEVQTNHLQPDFPTTRKNYVLGDLQRTDMLQFNNTFTILNQKTGEWLVINGSNKTYIKQTWSKPEDQRKMPKPDTFLSQLVKLSALPSTAAGEEKIDGVATRKIVIQNAKLGGYTGEMMLWYDAKTKLPVRIYHEVDDTFPKITRTLNNFQWNVPIDGKLFTPEIPREYVEDKR
ncbi:MAG TPA: hypothetical protein PLN21_10490 [Gemmatales bacterium]|nr:hypothetical protein [Gemmatales bacterium]